MQPFNLQPSTWNALISQFPNPHFLQTTEWAQVKANYGWQPLPFVWYEGDDVVAAAMILKRALPIRGFSARLSVLYAPKGPLMDWENEALRERVLGDLQSFAKKQGAIFLKLDPDVVLGTGIPESEDEQLNSVGENLQSSLSRRGWRYSDDQIQFRNSVLVDLTEAEDDILMRMKSKTRYNIRLAGRKGVVVRVGTPDDWEMLYKIYAETSVRDGFAIRDENYYKTVWSIFSSQTSDFRLPLTEPLIAEVDGEPVAAIFVFYFADRAYYVYGMSTTNHRNKMPTYLLQWEAMKRAKERGCTTYDLWGAPETFDESDSMWGVFRFKQGLGGEVVRTIGAWDYAPNPLWYKLYTKLIPRVLDVMRSRGKKRTRRVTSHE
ncbi:MAG: peptidoglycan bridge formation glycyltransferase FemA/FemB family protein [Anaerolineae bacterium]|jgi:peptidoglycan pentaglycine glycine transferase (the first glycine)|nr:peptidoglycan bridge formation glycyltransferase FemA/FemB family protein [Anaerolineae bacterium]